jgi:hypothetical protein
VDSREGTNVARHDAEAFHLPERYEPVPDLTDEVEGLWDAGRYASALDAILRFLRTNGPSAGAFRWALSLLSTIRATPDPSVVEPITYRQQRHPYFAPIASECARCQKFWYSSHPLTGGGEGMVVLNPMGRQCQVCRYTLCRNCGAAQDARCPEPGCSGEFGVPVLPTGRPRGMPANPHTEKLEHVQILWQGTQTSPEEITELLDLACAWQDCGGITVRSNETSERDFTQDTGRTLIGWAEADGQVSPGALERTRIAEVASPGLGRRLLFITAAPATGAAASLSGPMTVVVSRKRPPARRGWFRRGPG